LLFDNLCAHNRPSGISHASKYEPPMILSSSLRRSQLALHWAYLTCPGVNQPEPQRSAAILCRLRELRGERDPVYRHYADKVAAGEVLVPNGKLAFDS
jgi:hypothetical protein